MEENTLQQYEDIFFHILEGKERISTPTWKLPFAVTSCQNLALIYDGEAFFCQDGKDYKVSRGNLVYCDTGVARTIFNQKDNPVRFFAIDFQAMIPHCAQETLQKISLPLQTLEEINDTYLFSRLLGLFKNFVNLWVSHENCRQIRCRSLMNEIIRLLLLWKHSEGFSYDTLRKTEKIIAFLQTHYQDKIYLQELAALAGVSESYLCQIFKKNTEKTPMEYLMHFRIRKACELLQNGYSVTAAAEKTGFSDVYYFSRCFKHLQGTVPSQYKTAASGNVPPFLQ